MFNVAMHDLIFV